MSVNPMNYFSLQSSNEEELYLYAQKQDLKNVLKGRVQNLTCENKRLLRNLEEQRIQMKHLIDQFSKYQTNQTDKYEKLSKDRDTLEADLGNVRQKFHESVESIAKLTGYIKQLQIKKSKAYQQKEQIKIQYTYLLEKFKLANEHYKQSLQQYQGIQKMNHSLTQKNEELIKEQKKIAVELKQFKEMHETSKSKSQKQIQQKLAQTVDKTVYESIFDENRKLRKNIEELKEQYKNYKKKTAKKQYEFLKLKQELLLKQSQHKIIQSLKNDILWIFKILQDETISQISQPIFKSSQNQRFMLIYDYLMKQKSVINTLKLQNEDLKQAIEQKNRHLFMKQIILDQFQQKITAKNHQLANQIQHIQKQSQYKLLALSLKIQQESAIVNLIRQNMQTSKLQQKKSELKILHEPLLLDQNCQQFNDYVQQPFQSV